MCASGDENPFTISAIDNIQEAAKWQFWREKCVYMIWKECRKLAGGEEDWVRGVAKSGRGRTEDGWGENYKEMEWELDEATNNIVCL